MVKKPTSKDKPKVSEPELSEAVQDAVEDAVIIDETPAEPESLEDEVVSEEPDEAKDQDATPSEDGALKPDPSESEVIDASNNDLEKTAADSDTSDQESPAEPDAPAPVVQKRGGAGGFVALVLGGVIAAGIGFGAARYVVPDGWPFPGVTPAQDPNAQLIEAQGALIDQLTTKIDANAAEIERLATSTNADETIGALKADMVAGQAHLTEDISSLSDQVAQLNERLTALEKIPQGDGAAAAAAAAEAYERELTAMRSMLDAELAKITATQENAKELEVSAAESAKAAAARAALSRIMAALETGRPFDQAVFDYETATGETVPAQLADLAKGGAPTLITLQDDFPDLALKALDASIRAAVEDGSMNKVNAFMRTQLGMRSLEPKEGDDPDAILSRAEFALKNGNISGSLAEIETLPEVAKTILSDWVARAQTRANALEAGQALAEMNN
ncbi:MAG: COG4223 family protein [Maritimibacter sp.]